MTQPRVCTHESSPFRTTDLLVEHFDRPALEAGLDDAERRFERLDELIGAEDVLGRRPPGSRSPRS
jgi:hypothetical protein